MLIFLYKLIVINIEEQ